MSRLLCHNNVTPFTSRQYYSLVGRFFFLGAPACDSPLEKSASEYSSSFVLFEVSLANYSFRMPNAGQNCLFSFWSPAASLVCHWSVDQVGGRGLLCESLLLRHLKGHFISETEVEGAR